MMLKILRKVLTLNLRSLQFKSNSQKFALASPIANLPHFNVCLFKLWEASLRKNVLFYPKEMLF